MKINDFLKPDRLCIISGDAMALASGIQWLQILAGIMTIYFMYLGIRIRQIELKEKKDDN
jgi:hypothetical protein